MNEETIKEFLKLNKELDNTKKEADNCRGMLQVSDSGQKFINVEISFTGRCYVPTIILNPNIDIIEIQTIVKLIENIKNNLEARITEIKQKITNL